MVSKVESFFQRIAIIGLGLLGGSWGLALKKVGYCGRVVGCGRRQETVSQALEKGAIDEGTRDPAAAIRDADLIILSTPVGTIIDLLPVLKDTGSPRALVTDVGSTKEIICRRAAAVLGEEPLFLGAHPMAGKERSGIEFADPDLFHDACYVLTPLKPQDLTDERVKAFAALVEKIGAHPFVTDPVTHDRAVAYLSHLPQLLSSGLASLVGEASAAENLPLALAATGFRDVTRLADSPYSVWRDICLTNRANISEALDKFIQELEQIKMNLSDPDLEREFGRAQQLRAKLRELK